MVPIILQKKCDVHILSFILFSVPAKEVEDWRSLCNLKSYCVYHKRENNFKMNEIILYLSVTNFKVGEICACYFIITIIDDSDYKINNYIVFVVSKILSRQKFNQYFSIFYSIIFK